MRIFCTALLGLSMAFSSVDLRADAQRIDSFRKLAAYWAAQPSSMTGWLGAGVDPGYVPAVPPDSSLWSPGTVLLLDENSGLRQIGSGEKVITAGGLKVLGRNRLDVAVFQSLIFGSAPNDSLKLRDLPGVLEAFGVIHLQPEGLIQDLETVFSRYGIHRVTLSLPDAQVHRLVSADLKAWLAEGAPKDVLRLLAKPQARLITAGVFIRTIQLRFNMENIDPGLPRALENFLGSRLRSPGDGSVELDSHGLYVAIQTARQVFQNEAGKPEATNGNVVDATGDTRDSIIRLIDRVIRDSTMP